MQRSVWLSAAVLGLALLRMATPGLAAEGEKEEKGMCSQCRPGGIMEHETMRAMMERMMGGREAHRRISISPLELKEELKLSKEQVEAVTPIEFDYRKVTIKKQADIRVAEVELGALLDQKKPDREALKKKIREIGDLQADLMMYRVESLLKLREILTEEQHETFRALLKERMARVRAGSPMHGMGGMMP